MRRILFLVSNMNMGGAQRVAATLCNAWAMRGDEVKLIATYSGSGQCFYQLSDRVQFVYLADLVRSAVRSPWGYLKRLMYLRKLIREYRPDVAVSFLTNVNVATIAASLGLGVPVIACERIDPVAQTDLTTAYRWLRRLLYPFAEMVTVQSAAAAGRFLADVPGIRRLEVVSNPIPKELADTQIQRCQAKDRRRLVAMGRLSEQKQFDLLIKTFAGLAPRFLAWDLWIFGDGPLRGVLEQQVRAQGLTGRVYLPGHTTKPWTELAGADAFALPSAFEGFPNALLEAMALGLPCVAFDCPSGPREISRDGQDALLVPLGDLLAFEQSLAKIMVGDENAETMGARAAASVRARYAIETVLSRWDDLISEVCR